MSPHYQFEPDCLARFNEAPGSTGRIFLCFRSFIAPSPVISTSSFCLRFPSVALTGQVLAACYHMFECLPFAAVVNQRIFCVHGGLGRFENLLLADIASIVRPVQTLLDTTRSVRCFSVPLNVVFFFLFHTLTSRPTILDRPSDIFYSVSLAIYVVPHCQLSCHLVLGRPAG
jgi:hypothetical protein